MLKRLFLVFISLTIFSTNAVIAQTSDELSDIDQKLLFSSGRVFSSFSMNHASTEKNDQKIRNTSIGTQFGIFPLNRFALGLDLRLVATKNDVQTENENAVEYGVFAGYYIPVAAQIALVPEIGATIYADKREYRFFAGMGYVGFLRPNIALNAKWRVGRLEHNRSHGGAEKAPVLSTLDVGIQLFF